MKQRKLNIMRGISEDFFLAKNSVSIASHQLKSERGARADRAGEGLCTCSAARHRRRGFKGETRRTRRAGQGRAGGGRSWPGFDGNRGGKKGPPGGGDPRAGEQAATAGFHANRQGAETRRGGGARREEIRHRGGVDTSGKVAERQASAFYLFFLPRKEYLFLFFKQFFLNF